MNARQPMLKAALRRGPDARMLNTASRQHRAFRLGLAAAMLCLVLAGCGGEAAPTNTPPPTQALNPVPTTVQPTVVPPTATLTQPPSAADIARTATAQAPTPDATERARAAQRDLALDVVSAATGQSASALRVVAVTGVRAGREIEGCGRALSGNVLASVLSGETVTEVLIDDGEATVCGTVNLYDDRPELYLTLDPVAADLTELAIQGAARSAEAEISAVVIDSVRPMTWADPAACEADATTPNPESARGTTGYRIVLTVDDREFVYHTDFDRLIPCSAE